MSCQASCACAGKGHAPKLSSVTTPPPRRDAARSFEVAPPWVALFGVVPVWLAKVWLAKSAVAVVLERRRPVKQKSEATIKRQMDKIERGVAVMARDLGVKPWCTGNAFTLADIACGVALGYLDFRHDSFDWRVQHTNLAKLAAKLAERPSFADTAPREAQVAATAHK